MKYYIIGGQYRFYCYGTAGTLESAKRKATQNIELWDNWQGWHYPYIYAEKDVEKFESTYGTAHRPKPGAMPAACRNYGDKWTVME